VVADVGRRDHIDVVAAAVDIVAVGRKLDLSSKHLC